MSNNEDNGMEQKAFEALEKEFQDVMNELSS